MRPARSVVFLLFALAVYLPLHAKSKHLTVTGTLTQLTSGSNGFSGWAIQLNPVITVDGRQLSNLEIQTPHRQKLESLQDEFVEAKGTLATATSFESGDRPVLQLSSIRSVKSSKPDAGKPKPSFWSSLASFFSFSPI